MEVIHDIAYAVDAVKSRIEASSRPDAITDTTFPKQMTPDLAEFIGMLVAEGYCGDRGVMQFTQNDTVILDRYRELAFSLFGRKTRLVKSINKVPYLKMQSVTIQAYLEALGVSWSISREKTIPRAIRVAPEPCVRAFLRAVLGLEGHVSIEHNSTVRFELSMASEKLMRQIQMLLLNYGIVSRLNKKTSSATNGSRIQRDYWRNVISGVRNITLLRDCIGLIEERKQLRLEVDCDDTTARDWIPEAHDLIGNVMAEIQTARFPLKSTFDATMNKKLRKVRSQLEGRKLTVSFAEQIVDALDVLGVDGPASNYLRYLVECGFAYTQVKKIEDGMAETVDLTVPGTHSFFANGLVSHNTTALLWFAYCAAMQGFNAMYFTCEVSHEVIEDRLDAMIAEVSIKHLPDEIVKVADAVKTKKPTGKVFIYEYPTKRLTVTEIERQARRLVLEKGVQIDMIVDDYAGINKARRSLNDPLKEEAEIMEDLRSLAYTFHVPVLTGNQINRTGANKALVKGTDTAGTFEKIMIVDGNITISGTDDEVRDGLLRIHLSDMRNAPSRTFKIKTAFNLGRFYKEFVEEEV